MASTFALRAIDAAGTREVVGDGPLRITLDSDDHRLAPLVLPAAEERLGAPVLLLGAGPDGVIEVEVIGSALPSGLHWQPLAVDRSGRPPWGQPGWYDATCDEIDAALTGLNRRRTGPVIQERIWSIAALMRVATDAGELWFKQVPDLFAVEGRLTAWLGERLPSAVPRIVHVAADWWLAEALAPSVRGFADMAAFSALGELQRATVGHDQELLSLGCPDRRLPLLLPELYAAVGRPPLADSQWSALVAARSELDGCVVRLEALQLPDTLVHGDFHGGNVCGTEDGWVIYDWTDGCVSHPLLDLQPVLSARPWSAADLTAGLERWWPGLDLADDDWAAVRVLGLAHQVVSYLRITAALGDTGEGEWAQESRRFADELLTALG